MAEYYERRIIMRKINEEFCNSVIEEYSKRFSESEIKNGYKGMDIQIARIAMDVFKIAFEKLDTEHD